MIDRNNRNQLILAIQSFLDEKTDALQFDEIIFDIDAKTEDETIHFAVEMLWLYYDDFKPHKVTLIKEEWDAIQRLILLLSSDREIVQKKKWHYTARQLVAVGLLALYALICFYVAIGLTLFYATIGLGLLSIALSLWKREYESNKKVRWEIYPFTTVTQLRNVRSETAFFQKQHYPVQVGERSIRTPFANALLHIHSKLSWLVYAPLVLLYQALPEIDRWVEIKKD